MLRNDDLAVFVHRDLRVVALDEPVGCLLDPGLRIGEVTLRLVRRTSRLGILPFRGRLLPRLRLKRRPGLLDLLQPRLSPCELLGQLVSASVAAVASILFLVHFVRTAHHRLHFPAQRRLLLLHPSVAHRLVLGGVGLDLRPIQGHPPQLHQPRATAQPQHLLEQPRQRRTMALAEIADRAEIRLIARRQEAEGHAVHELRGDPTRGVRARAVAVQQQLHHHPRMVGRVAPLLLVGALDGRQIQRIGQVTHTARQVALRHPVRQGRRKQQRLIRVVGSECFSHTAKNHSQ